MAQPAGKTVIEVPEGQDLISILLYAKEIGVSDIHLTVGSPPMYRLHGEIVSTNLPVLDRRTLHNLLYDLLDDQKRAVLERENELDFSLQFGDQARFRGNCFYTMWGEGAVFRVIPTVVPTADELRLPQIINRVAESVRGLVLVTGPTGSGKSTTLAAMIDHINSTRSEHILTIEDPIEFVHKAKKGIVNQRELGSNTKSFSNALRAALREDPDVILVGEMRDLETISLAITAAETGHLVLGTLHTMSAPKTCDRLIDVFPPDQQPLVRQMFAESFQAIICQTLIPRADGKGRVAAFEILLGTTASRSLIREGKTYQLPTIIQTGRASGMQSMDQHLKDLVMRRIITEKQGMARANNPEFVVRGSGEKGFSEPHGPDMGGAAAPTSPPPASSTPVTQAHKPFPGPSKQGPPPPSGGQNFPFAPKKPGG